jgi:CubicO group peptidase (beta-lactamase class C family)
LAIAIGFARLRPMTTLQRPVRRWSVLALTLLFITPLGAAEKPKAKVDKLFAQWDMSDSPGAAIVIVKGDSVVYQRGYGSANLEIRTPITPQTVFDVASVAKQFAGLAVAMLVEDGKISLDDEVRKYLPHVPDFGKPITIRHLVYHTSGLRDWPETLALSGLDWSGVITLETILEMVQRQRELDFAPGEEYQYCNTGYNLLAATVAKVTNQSFREWSTANIFKPLGMKHTHVCDSPADVVLNRAESYMLADKKFTRAISQLAAEGSSSLFISAEDMAKWMLNFKTARVGGKALERMCEPGKLNSGKKVDYGFGIGLSQYHGSKKISHTGSWAGYRSIVMFVPEKDFAVAILANAANVNTSSLATKIADIYLNPSPSANPSEATPKLTATDKPDPSSWDNFIGTYRLRAGWLLDITREGDQLIAQATREEKFKMTPTSGAKFFVQGYGSSVEFVSEKSGPATHLLYRGIRAPKLSVPKFTPEQLQDYVGDYWSDELRVAYRVEMRDGSLGVRQRSGAWVRFLATGTDRFDADQGGATIEFTRNGASDVTELKVSGGRIRNVRFIRSTLPHATSASLK